MSDISKMVSPTWDHCGLLLAKLQSLLHSNILPVLIALRHLVPKFILPITVNKLQLIDKYFKHLDLMVVILLMSLPISNYFLPKKHLKFKLSPFILQKASFTSTSLCFRMKNVGIYIFDLSSNHLFKT